MTHYGPRGRATNVFPVESERLSKLLKDQPSQNTSKDMVAKLYWPEQSRESEPDILKKVQAIAEKNPDVNSYIPEIVWFHEFDETSTASIRKIIGIDKPDRGSRALYIIVFRKLVQITTLSGKELLKA
jgi:predicted type IV restriction endonuclease